METFSRTLFRKIRKDPFHHRGYLKEARTRMFQLTSIYKASELQFLKFLFPDYGYRHERRQSFLSSGIWCRVVLSCVHMFRRNALPLSSGRWRQKYSSGNCTSVRNCTAPSEPHISHEYRRFISYALVASNPTNCIKDRHQQLSS
jgi:hypothetical protein